MLGRIIGVIITTFMIAIVYGFYCGTMDFLTSRPDPVQSGHHAAGGVYGLFGVVSDEIKNNDARATSHVSTVGRKIAMPYAVTADLSAILTGKLELAITSVFHVAEKKIDKTADAR